MSRQVRVNIASPLCTILRMQGDVVAVALVDSVVSKHALADKANDVVHLQDSFLFAGVQYCQVLVLRSGLK